MQHVERVYKRAYLLTRPRLVAATGGGVSLKAVLAVASAHAAAADHRTGRNSRPLLGISGGPSGLTGATGLGQRTVSRARTFLRLAQLATEIQPGRHRSLTERLISWERGDTARGWTADYALHPSPTYPDPVDNPGRVVAGQTPDGTPPLCGGLTPPRSGKNGVSSTDNRSTAPPSGDEDGAPRRASTNQAARDGSTESRSPATALMLAWRASERCPRWARRYGAHRWSGALTAAAVAGWTARDLDQLLVDLAGTGHQVLHEPRRPISYLCYLLSLVDLAERPTALLDAQAAEDLAHRRASTATQLHARDTAAAARAVGVVALAGPGRAAALAVAETTAAAVAGRRSQRAAADRLAQAQQVHRLRGR